MDFLWLPGTWHFHRRPVAYWWTGHLPSTLSTTFLIGTLGMGSLIHFPLICLHQPTLPYPFGLQSPPKVQNCYSFQLSTFHLITDPVHLNFQEAFQIKKSISSFSSNVSFLLINSICIPLVSQSRFCYSNRCHMVFSLLVHSQTVHCVFAPL